MWENKKYSMLFTDNSAMNYSITHYLYSTMTLEERIAKTTSATEVRIKETGAIYICQSDNTFKLQ